MEDKQKILSLLLPALQSTRNLNDLVSLDYDEDNGMVIACFACGGKKLANVEGNSGTSMIRDVIAQIL